MAVLKKGAPSKFIFVFIRITLNNLFFTALSKRGNVLFWISAGCCGFKGPRRSTPLAAEQTGRAFSDRLAAAGFDSVEVELFSPLGVRAKGALKGLSHSGALFINSIRYLPPRAHNGLRSKKRRRV